MSELSPTELRDLTDLFALVEAENPYAILGVVDDAASDEIKNSYYELSRKYHPDRFYRREISGYRDLIEAVFTGINQSYEMLADETARRRYDLERAREDRKQEREASREDSGQTRRRSWRENLQSSSSLGTAADAKPTVEKAGFDGSADDTQKIRRAKLRSSIREAAPPRRPPPAYRKKPDPPTEPTLARAVPEKPVEEVETSPPKTDSEPEAPESSLEREAPKEPPMEAADQKTTEEELTRTRSRSARRSRPIVGKSRNPAKAVKHFEEGKREYDSGNFIKAASSLYLAMTFDSENQEYKELNELVQQKARNMRSMQFVNQAENAESFGSWREALEHYQKAVECEPNEGLAYFRLAQLLIHKVDDPRAAMSNLRQAVLYEPENHRYRIALAHLYVIVGMPRNAEREFQRVLDEDPKNSAAKQGLRKARA